MPSDRNLPELHMSADNLYREEIFTDRKVGNIRQLTPVKADGESDSSRPILFVGQSQILTPMGAIPITFEIPAATLSEALEKFGAEANVAVENTLKELQEMRRESASSIVIPGQESAGKIRLR
jgi:hypothetical protein